MVHCWEFGLSSEFQKHQASEFWTCIQIIGRDNICLAPLQDLIIVTAVTLNDCSA